VQDFLEMMRRREGERLDVWLAQVHESGLAELQSFAQGVEQDKAAVQAGLTLPLSNGQVEGQVTKIKLIKRMMYGRAEFPLLRKPGLTCPLTRPQDHKDLLRYTT
jgi:transposase